MVNHELHKSEEPWYHWKHVAGYAYILICLVDFVVMPIVLHNDRIVTRDVIIEQVVENADLALELIDRNRVYEWSPMTMVGGGLFHISFGAILTGAAVTRGFERREIVRNGNSNGNGHSK